MNYKLQQSLYDKYPKIFIQKDLPMQTTAMCWGISCGDGWYHLLDNLCGNIQNRLQNINRNKVEGEKLVCEAVQVKEKFGGLCFYVQGGDDYIDGLIDMAESMSYSLCSSCGATLELQNSMDRGWVYTKCNTCNN